MTKKYVKDIDLTGELLERNNEETPDFLELKLKKYHPVFVYGTLKAGGRLHHVLEGCPFLGDAMTITSAYKMSVTRSAFPIIRPQTTGGAHIYGEVYMCDVKTIAYLDHIESNGTMYNREERHVWLLEQSYKAGGKSCYPSIKASVYIADRDFWADQPVKLLSTREDSKRRKIYDFDVYTRIAA